MIRVLDGMDKRHCLRHYLELHIHGQENDCRCPGHFCGKPVVFNPRKSIDCFPLLVISFVANFILMQAIGTTKMRHNFVAGCVMKNFVIRRPSTDLYYYELVSSSSYHG